MTDPLLLSLDQGTTSSRAILFEKDGSSVFTSQHEFRQYYPQSGWVEHDADEIWNTTLTVCLKALKHAKGMNRNVVAIGIANQRETTVIWDRDTGEPIYNAIVWQDRRTDGVCSTLIEAGHEAAVSAKTGLRLDPYFSGTKIAWILDNVTGAREKAERGELAFGTIDSFLIWRLTNAEKHVTDTTNASRTLLFNIHTNDWDESLLSMLDIPKNLLPEVQDCASEFGTTDKAVVGDAIPIRGVAGDQHAASIGQVCFQKGMIKSTYGTGCFVMLNTGSTPIVSNNRMLTTIGYRLDGVTAYAMEGSIFAAGAAVQWLRDGLGVIKSADETESMAVSLEGNGGVYLVPAFTGMGAPYWDSEARGALYGITRDTGPKELVRAALESVCYQTMDLFEAMRSDGATLDTVRIDGGMVKNNWLSQTLADVLCSSIERPEQTETTALGVAYLAGLQSGVYGSLDDLSNNWRCERTFTSKMERNVRDSNVEGWRDAVRRTRSTM